MVGLQIARIGIGRLLFRFVGGGMCGWRLVRENRILIIVLLLFDKIREIFRVWDVGGWCRVIVWSGHFRLPYGIRVFRHLRLG